MPLRCDEDDTLTTKMMMTMMMGIVTMMVTILCYFTSLNRCEVSKEPLKYKISFLIKLEMERLSYPMKSFFQCQFRYTTGKKTFFLINKSLGIFQGFISVQF